MGETHRLDYLVEKGKKGEKMACCHCSRETDHSHVCVVGEKFCCGMCKAENEDGSDVDNLKKWVICKSCSDDDGAAGGMKYLHK